MTEVNITVEDLTSEIPGATLKLVKISGQLDESNVDEKSKEIYAIIEQTPKGLSLVFDLENLEYMNSKSIGYLTDWYGKINEGGGKIVLSNAKPNILDILNVVGLTQLIPNFATLDEAKFAIAKQDA
jgi:anti-anti-sigma factor